MARFRTPNFHNARLSVAQSLIRELVAKRASGAAASGLFPNHPILQAASHVLQRVDRGEITDAQTADAAYKAHRATQTAQGVTVASTIMDEISSVIGKIESVFHTAESLVITAATCADLAARYAIAWAMNDAAKMTEIRSEWTDSGCDLTGWATAVETYLESYGSHHQPFYNPPANAQGQDQPPFITPGTFALPPAAGGTLRVGVLGDWGTGEQEAIAVLDQLMRCSPDVIIHVGDVYYAGTADEQTTQFLDPVKAARAKHGRNIPVYTLPGNHDYYCGGAPFYAVIPQLNEGVPAGSTQTHSFWALANERWQLQGMDTGYHDSDLFEVAEDTTHLRDDEAAWHLERTADAARNGRTVILFSHHQLVSAFEKIGGVWTNPRLEANLASWQQAGASPLDPAGRIVAWFWGHEHVLEVYEPYHPTGSRFAPVLGRCVGNSAFPVFTDSSGYTRDPAGFATLPESSSPGGAIPFPNDFVQSQPDDLVWASGYALLDLPATGDATACYYQVQFNGDVSAATSQLLWKEPIPAASPAPNTGSGTGLSGEPASRAGTAD